MNVFPTISEIEQIVRDRRRLELADLKLENSCLRAQLLLLRSKDNPEVPVRLDTKSHIIRSVINGQPLSANEVIDKLKISHPEIRTTNMRVYTALNKLVKSGELFKVGDNINRPVRFTSTKL